MERSAIRENAINRRDLPRIALRSIRATEFPRDRQPMPIPDPLSAFFG